MGQGFFVKQSLVTFLDDGLLLDHVRATVLLDDNLLIDRPRLTFTHYFSFPHHARQH